MNIVERFYKEDKRVASNISSIKDKLKKLEKEQDELSKQEETIQDQIDALKQKQDLIHKKSEEAAYKAQDYLATLELAELEAAGKIK